MKLPHNCERWALDRELPQLLALPLTPEERVKIPGREPLDRLRQLALKGKAAHLAVGDDFDPSLLLEPEGLVDGAVLDLLQACLVELSRRKALAGIDQFNWSQEAADDVRSCRD